MWAVLNGPDLSHNDPPKFYRSLNFEKWLSSSCFSKLRDLWWHMRERGAEQRGGLANQLPPSHISSGERWSMAVEGGQWLIGAGCDCGGQKVEAAKWAKCSFLGSVSGADEPASSWWSFITRLLQIRTKIKHLGSILAVAEGGWCLVVVRGGLQLPKRVWGFDIGGCVVGVRKCAQNGSEAGAVSHWCCVK